MLYVDIHIKIIKKKNCIHNIF